MSDAPHAKRRYGWLLPFVCGAATVGLVGAAGGLATVQWGLYDTTASAQHGAFVAWAAHTTFIHATQIGARNVKPPTSTPADVEAGRKLYVQDCEQCHGGPATPRAAWTAGLNPPPPFLLDSQRRWTPAELHRVIGEGVKLTAMPAWRFTLTDPQIWDLVAFLDSFTTTPPAAYPQAKGTTAPTPGPTP
jgi:mono/diheme cytochrome c family protein